MNLGELIVELSLDSAQFTQELDAAKKELRKPLRQWKTYFPRALKLA